MATLMLLGIAGLTGLGVWLCAGGEPRPAAVEGVRLALARRGAASCLAWLGGLGPLDWLAHVPPVAESLRLLGEAKLVRAWGLGPEALRGLGALALIAAACLGLVLSGPVGAVVCPVALVALALSRASALRKRREGELARQVPGMFRSLAVALGAGRTLSQAISYVGSRGDDVLSREFGRAALMVSCGISAPDALEELAARTKAPGLDLMVCALVVSARTGAPLEGLFQRLARLVERRFELERELLGKTAQVRLSARLVSALPVGLVAVLALISPDFREGLATPVGTGSVCVAALLDVCALLIIRHLMRRVL